MAEFINTIDVLGDDAVIDSIINRTITEFKDNTVTYVGQYAFYKCSELEEADLPQVKDVGNYAFYGCSSLKRINLPKLTGAGVSPFVYCSELEEVDLPLCKNIGTSAGGGFDSCTKLSKVNLPLLTRIEKNCFLGTAIKSVRFPSATHVYINAFRNCAQLTTCDFQVLVSISNNAFADCTALTALIIRTGSVCDLRSVSALSGTVYVYVPKALVDSYKAATNWSTFADQIRAIEDYPEITGG